MQSLVLSITNDIYVSRTPECLPAEAGNDYVRLKGHIWDEIGGGGEKRDNTARTEWPAYLDQPFVVGFGEKTAKKRQEHLYQWSVMRWKRIGP
jgi:hypothetical protein